MAKAKAKAKAKVSNNSNNLPAGYKMIGRAPSWDVDKNSVLEGERGSISSITFDKGTKKERDQRIMIVQDETLGAVTVWESSMLKDMFDQTNEGDTVRIEFLGYAEAKKGQQAAKLFSVAVKE